MLTFLRRFGAAFLFDEAAAQRYLAAGAFMVGSFLESGGVIPGTAVVVPIGDWKGVGTALKGLAFFLAAGGRIPGPSLPVPSVTARS